jgi:hypothetical protein
VDIFSQLAEGRIAEAMAKGEFDCLPGTGKPLPRDDYRLMSPQLRMAYRILKNAGIVPTEVALRKEIADIETLLQALPPGQEQIRAAQQRDFLLTKLSVERGGRLKAPHIIGFRGSAKRRRR